MFNTVNIAASASDNVKVAGVMFFWMTVRLAPRTRLRLRGDVVDDKHHNGSHV